MLDFAAFDLHGLCYRDFIILTSSEPDSPYSLLHSPVISSNFVSYTFLKILFSKARNICSAAKTVLKLSQT